MSNKIEGIPDGWELVRIGQINPLEYWINCNGKIHQWEHATSTGKNFVIISKIEKPKQYRSFANAAEYYKNGLQGFAVDWKTNDTCPGFFTVVSANELYCWVAFGNLIERFEWERAFDKLQFRHVDNSTSPFGIEVTE